MMKPHDIATKANIDNRGAGLMYLILSEQDNKLIVAIPGFNPSHTFLCGQCFRWNPENNGVFAGIAHGRLLRLSWDGEVCTFYDMDKQEFTDKWVKYFDLETDYCAIKKILSSKDEHLHNAIIHGNGIHLLRQDFYETLFSFLISQNNNIPRIKQIIESISKSFGTPINSNNGHFDFPEVVRLASVSLDSLSLCRGGYRCRYISETSKKLEELPAFESEIKSIPVEKARELLLSLPGIGPKVADCVLLYSGIDRTAFPIDRWVKRVMETLYLKKESNEKEIRAFSKEYFGDLAGIAQQYLFYYAREMRI